jgi:signal peptidase I
LHAENLQEHGAFATSAERLTGQQHKMLADYQNNASIRLASGLAEEVVLTFGELRLRVFGTSMVPSILPGDFVSIHRAGLNEISPGEIVLFRQLDRLFVHRVVDRKVMAAAAGAEGPCLITRGDRLRHNDLPVTSSELLGRVISIQRGDRKVEMQAHGLNSPMVRVLQSSDRLTSLYLRLAAYWRALFPRRAKCQA